LHFKFQDILLEQGYSNGGPRSESGPLDGDGRTLSTSRRYSIPRRFYPKILRSWPYF